MTPGVGMTGPRSKPYPPTTPRLKPALPLEGMKTPGAMMSRGPTAYRRTRLGSGAGSACGTSPWATATEDSSSRAKAVLTGIPMAAEPARPATDRQSDVVPALGQRESPGPMDAVGLFIPCYVDQLYP